MIILENANDTENYKEVFSKIILNLTIPKKKKNHCKYSGEHAKYIHHVDIQ